MKAMILAAGLGTRLRPLTQNTPKALILVDGQPLITYSLKLLQKYKIRDVLINLHHLGDLIQKELGDGSKWGLKITYSWEPHILGTGGGIKKAASFFQDETFLVLNSDILIDLNIKQLFSAHRKRKAMATMVVRQREADSSYTPVFLGRGDRILSIGENLNNKEPAKESFLYTGVQVLEPSFLDLIPFEREACLIKEGYQPAIAQGKKIYGYVYDGYWNDLGTFERYRQAEKDLQAGRAKLSFL